MDSIIKMKKIINKTGIRFYYLIISIILLINCNSYCQSGKPDLIIQNVELRYESPNPPHMPGEPVSSGDNLPHPVFYINVVNIGKKEISEPFSIASTNSEYDLRKGRYSHWCLVNTQKYIIKINESIIFKVGGPYGGSKYFKFAINVKPEDLYLYSSVEEERYDNNTYECLFSNFR